MNSNDVLFMRKKAVIFIYCRQITTIGLWNKSKSGRKLVFARKKSHIVLIFLLEQRMFNTWLRTETCRSAAVPAPGLASTVTRSTEMISKFKTILF